MSEVNGKAWEGHDRWLGARMPERPLRMVMRRVGGARSLGCGLPGKDRAPASSGFSLAGGTWLQRTPSSHCSAWGRLTKGGGAFDTPLFPRRGVFCIFNWCLLSLHYGRVHFSGNTNVDQRRVKGS